MCGRTIGLFVLILGLVGPAVAQDWDIEIPSVNKPPIVDGELDSSWAIAPVQEIKTTIDGTVSSPEDCSGAWRAMWDAEYLYVIVDVVDDALRNDSGSAYLDDSVEFYFDGGNTKGPGTPLSDDDRQYTFGWHATDIQGTNTNTTGVELAQVDTPTGWRIEMRFPWQSLQGAAPVLDGLIGIDCFLNDDDDGGDSREGQVATFATAGTHWQVPSAWGTAKLVKGSSEKASAPSPADGATNILRSVVLEWAPGEFAATHDVYFGTVFDDVSNADRANPLSVLAGRDQAAAEFDPDGLLEFGQTYYWRIDEVNGAPDFTVSKGDVWRFTTEPFVYPIQNVTPTASSAQPGMSAVNAVNGKGLNADDQHSTDSTDMWMTDGAQPAWIQFEFDKVYKLYELWVWNSNQLIEGFIGFGARDVTVEYSTDGAAWTTLEGVPEFARAAGAPTYTANTTVDFGGTMAKFVKLTINTNWGGVAPQTGLSEVRFFYVPVQAYDPTPADGATDVAIDGEFGWRSGREATSHLVFFDADRDALATAAGQTVTEAAFTPPSMEFGTEYFWKVDEIGDTGTYEGDVWSFTSQEFKAIDDFEAYNDDDNRIYQAWIDGVATGTSGSTVGYFQAPFAEKSIIHGGKQSMPLEYNNVNTPFYSEAEQEYSTAQDWTTNGADTLCLWVRGNPAGYLDNAGTITMSAGGHDIWDNADDFRFAYKTLNGDGSIVVKVESIENTNAWAKAGVMIRQSLEADSKFAYIIQSFSSGVSMGWRQMTSGTCGSTDQAGITAPQWVKLIRKGDVFTAQYSADGKTWIDLKDGAGAIVSTTVAMINPVYVGLCVTSHNTTATTTAVMSGAATTGNVTGGSWQVKAVGDDPQPANDPADLYVTVQDSAGQSATATNATAVNSAAWTQWQIPLSSLTGVNLKSVKKLTIGVDSRTSPIKGVGMIYLDDIGYGRPTQ